MITDPIYLDIETIPAQSVRDIAWLRKRHDSDVEALLASVKAAGNIKDPAKIADDIERKRQAIIDGDEAAFDSDYRKTSFDGALGQVVVCGLACGSSDPVAIFDSQWHRPGYEEWLLNEIRKSLTDMAGNGYGRLLVGHNILAFDRPFLRQRGIVKRVASHPLITTEVKPWDKGVVFDTMLAWTGSPALRVSMDKLCHIFGIEGKGDIDGSKVWDTVKAGRIEEVAAYCKGDIERTRAIHSRLTNQEN